MTNTTSDFAVETAGLTKAFGARKVVDSLDLRIPRGSVYAFLGRNGSGKTTTMRMLLGFLRPTAGASRVLGQNSRMLGPATRERIGYVAATHPLHEWMTVEETAWFASRFHDTWNASAFGATMAHFDVLRHARVKSLSLGERAALSVAIAIASEPELLVLDEPTTGLDPVARRSIMERVVAMMCDSGRTVFLSSHQLEDVVDVAEHVAVLDQGRLRTSGAVDELTSAVKRYRLSFAPGKVPVGVPTIEGILSETRNGNELVLTVLQPDLAFRAWVASVDPLRVVESPVPALHALLSYLAPATAAMQPASGAEGGAA